MSKVYVAVFCAAALFGSSIFAAEPKEELIQAAKALGGKENYSWVTKVSVPPDARFRPGPTEGKTEQGGATLLKMSFRDSTTEAVIKGDSVAMKSEDGDWQSASELENEEGFRRFIAARLREFKAPAEQAQEILADVKELKKEGSVYSGELSAEGAKNLMRFRRGGDGPEISDAKGSAKFWVQDGVLSKFEYKVDGTMNFNGNDISLDRTTTTEIKEVGSTKVTVPEAARKKLS